MGLVDVGAVLSGDGPSSVDVPAPPGAEPQLEYTGENC